MLRRVKFFRRLGDDGLAKLRSRGLIKKVPRYATIIREGVLGQYFYVLLQGTISVTSSSGAVNLTLTQGAHFGEGSLVAEVKRQATVTALENCVLHQWSSADIQDVGDLELDEVRQHVVSQIVSNVYFFGNLSAMQINQLALILSVKYYSAQERIFHEGDPGDAFFIMAEGSVEMLKVIDSRLVPVATYEAGTERPWFGEMSMWTSQPRAATAVVSEPTVALVLQKEHFAQFLDIIPSFEAIISTSSSAFNTINNLHRRQSTTLDVNIEGARLEKTAARRSTRFKGLAMGLDTTARLKMAVRPAASLQQIKQQSPAA